MQPINMLIFGTLTGNIVQYASSLYNETATEEELLAASDKFIDDVTTFAIDNSLIGVAMLVSSYLSTVLFNYSALRQVCFGHSSIYYNQLWNYRQQDRMF